jgi:hypothetical protein
MRVSCRARAATGHAAALPTRPMNSRRLIASPKAQDRALHELRLARGGGRGTGRLGVSPLGSSAEMTLPEWNVR